MSNLPLMYHLQQTFPRPVVADIPAVTKQELVKLGLDRKVRPGSKIGIPAGSRGIQNLVPVLQATARYLKELGAEPCLIASMGSHGNGTANGQKEILDSFGLTEAAIGAKVVTGGECEIIDHTATGLPAYALKSVLGLDGILLVNRVKTHTSFKGKIESGLIKQLVVGIGGPEGAKHFHSFGPAELPDLLEEIGDVLLEKLPVLGGLALVENAYEETALIRGVPREGMIDCEAEVLAYSKSLMPSLPVDTIDLLIIQEMGKNFSGTGIDTNIVGRARIHGVPEPSRPDIKRIAVLDLSEESHGNATGIGMADFVTKKLVTKMDRQSTYLNCLTSTFVLRAAIPMYFDTEEKLVKAALYSLSGIPAEKLRIVIIPNTLFLTESIISEALVPGLSTRTSMVIDQTPRTFSFDANGAMQLRI